MTSEQESDLQEILQPSDVSVQDDQGIETEKILWKLQCVSRCCAVALSGSTEKRRLFHLIFECNVVQHVYSALISK